MVFAALLALVAVVQADYIPCITESREEGSYVALCGAWWHGVDFQFINFIILIRAFENDEFKYDAGADVYSLSSVVTANGYDHYIVVVFFCYLFN